MVDGGSRFACEPPVKKCHRAMTKELEINIGEGGNLARSFGQARCCSFVADPLG